jgi:hypothetical protein
MWTTISYILRANESEGDKGLNGVYKGASRLAK